ncbi:MAG: hypothetical protein H7Y04_11960 [Verrucomicrobia bacterium]|nr:hypothetical protein [Cytophagales bacterium]
MKKSFVIPVVLFFFIVNLSFAQNSVDADTLRQNPTKADTIKVKTKIDKSLRPGFISFNLGMSHPVGSYGKTDDFYAAGYATTGFQYNLEMAFFDDSKFTGFGFMAGGFFNPINKQTLLRSADIPSFQPKTITVSKNYRNTYLMVGPYLTFPAGRVLIDFKFLGGLVSANLPTYNLSGTVSLVGDRSYRLEDNQKPTLGYNFGTNIRFKTNSNFEFLVGCNYFSASPLFKYKFTRSQIMTNNDNFEYEGRQSITSFNINWGFAFRL